MKKRLFVTLTAIGAAVVMTLTAAAAVVPETPEEPAEAEGQPSARGYTLTEFEGGIGVFRDGELIMRSEVDIDGLRRVDRELLRQGIETVSFEDALRLLEDFGS